MFKIKNIKIPKQPGCYIMRGADGAIIYIGKAKNIKNRVKSYFRGEVDAKTKNLLSQINNIEFIVTDNEVEALLLEAKLIRKHKPKFNIDLKEGVRYAYIKITKEKFPRIISTRDIDFKKDNFYGPYPDGTSRRETVYLLNKIFKLRTCKRLPKSVCLLYHIGQCSAPCANYISEKDYNDNVKKAELALKGKIKDLVEKLRFEMSNCVKRFDYEKAKERRDQIFALERIAEPQKVSLKKTYNQDYINFLEKEDKLFVQIFNINKGILSGRKQFQFQGSKSDFRFFLTNYYYNNDIPEEIIIPEKIGDVKILEEYLFKLKKNRKVKVTVPNKGKKKEFLNLLAKNLALNLSELEKILLELKEKLNLQTLPKNIECFDISNIGKDFAVGSMVRFSDGKPDKSNYRRFKIKTVRGQDDVAMMGEIVFRRYFRLKKEKKILPDLIIVDGGKGQLNSAFDRLIELKLNIPLVSLAKKEEEIYFVGGKIPLKLDHKLESLKLLQRIRDEAHRFGIKYHRLLRSKGMIL